MPSCDGVPVRPGLVLTVFNISGNNCRPVREHLPAPVPSSSILSSISAEADSTGTDLFIHSPILASC